MGEPVGDGESMFVEFPFPVADDRSCVDGGGAWGKAKEGLVVFSGVDADLEEVDGPVRDDEIWDGDVVGHCR